MKKKINKKNKFFGSDDPTDDSVFVGPPVPDNYLDSSDNENSGGFFSNLVNNAGSILTGIANVRNSNSTTTDQPVDTPEKNNTGLVITVILVVIAIGLGIYLFVTRKS